MLLGPGGYSRCLGGSLPLLLVMFAEFASEERSSLFLVPTVVCLRYHFAWKEEIFGGQRPLSSGAVSYKI